MNKVRNAFIFIGILAFLDQLITYFCPVDFTFYGYSFVPHLCFCALLLLVYSQKTFNRILYGCLCGIVSGMFFGADLFVSFVLYGLFSYLIGLFSKWLQKDSWIEWTGVFLSFLVYDVICFFGAKLFGYIDMSFVLWFSHIELFTLLFNGIGIAILIYWLHIYKRYALIAASRSSRLERKKFQNLKRK